MRANSWRGTRESSGLGTHTRASCTLVPRLSHGTFCVLSLPQLLLNGLNATGCLQAHCKMRQHTQIKLQARRIMLGLGWTQNTNSAPGELRAEMLGKRQPVDGETADSWACGWEKPGITQWGRALKMQCCHPLSFAGLLGISAQRRATASSGPQHDTRVWIASPSCWSFGVFRCSVRVHWWGWWGTWERLLLCVGFWRVCLFPSAVKATQADQPANRDT